MKRLDAKRLAVGLAVVALVTLVAALAIARPGGGGSYSGGSSSRSSGGGSSSGGSSGGDGGSLIFELLLWLCIEHPVIGIPLMIIFIIVVIVSKFRDKKTSDWSAGVSEPSSTGYQRWVPPTPQPPPRASTTLDDVRQVDPGFSRVVFEDFLYSLYAEVQRARGAGTLDLVSAYLSPAAGNVLRNTSRGPVEAVIVGALRTNSVAAFPSGTRVVVEFDANYTEGGHGYYVCERWMLARGPGAKSRPPGRTSVLGCPSCGAPQNALFGGRCRHCNQIVNNGAFDWTVQSIEVLQKESRAPILTANVEEVGTDWPSIVDPYMMRNREALRAKDPAFDPQALERRVGMIFQQFQTAWAARELAPMRPFMSDALFTTQQYWVEAYRKAHLRNVTERARITRMGMVKVSSDAYYDAVTIRVWATGLDYTMSDDGKLVSGSRSIERQYSEYWTVIRGTNRKGPAKAELACANCGAPLDVTMAGDCKYCKVKVTTGDFDWVLSRIEQDDSYVG